MCSLQITRVQQCKVWHGMASISSATQLMLAHTTVHAVLTRCGTGYGTPVNACHCCLQGTRNITFEASQLFASAAQSRVWVTPGAPATTGEPQYVVASLLSSTGSPVVVADNAKVLATGMLCVPANDSGHSHRLTTGLAQQAVCF